MSENLPASAVIRSRRINLRTVVSTLLLVGLIAGLIGYKTQTLILLVAATGAVLLTMPSFFEIPLALSLLAGGVSAGAALAVLIAGPAINLASLLVIARQSHWKVARLVAVAVWVTAVAAGLLIG